jgi:hypothetical protein
MAKILWLNWSGGGNLPPSLGVARALTERGHSVAFAAVKLIGQKPSPQASERVDIAPTQRTPWGGSGWGCPPTLHCDRLLRGADSGTRTGGVCSFRNNCKPNTQPPASAALGPAPPQAEARSLDRGRRPPKQGTVSLVLAPELPGRTRVRGQPGEPEPTRTAGPALDVVWIGVCLRGEPEFGIWMLRSKVLGFRVNPVTQQPCGVLTLPN